MAKVDLKNTGYSSNTPNFYIINSASLWINVEYDPLTKKFQADRCLGATTEGVKLNVTQEFRQIDVDGVLTKAVGTDVIESNGASIETTVKEVTAEVLTLAITGTARDATDTEAPLGYKIIEPKGTIDKTDYIKNIGVVGVLSGSTQPIIAILYNALNTSGLSLETKDKGEAGVPLTLEARADFGDVANMKAPVKIFFPPIDKVVQVP